MGFSEDRARGQFGPLYLVVAENPYLLWDATGHWRTVCTREAEGEGGECRFDAIDGASLNLDNFAALLCGLPMFATRQLVIVRNVDKVPAARQEDFVRIIARRTESTRILLISSGLDKRLKWVKALLKLAPVEEFPRIWDNQLSGWAKRIAGDLGASLSPQAAELLAGVHGFDLFEMHQTIERALLYMGEPRRIETDDVTTVSAGEGSLNIFMLQAALARSDLAGALAIVRALFAGGDRSTLWLSVLYSHFKKLADVLELPRGLSDADAARQLHTKPFIFGKLRAGAVHFGEQGVAGALGAIFETDWAGKTSRVPPRLAFELLIYRLCRLPVLVGAPWFDLDGAGADE